MTGFIRMRTDLRSCCDVLFVRARISLAAANNKLAQADLTAARRAEHVHLGIPTYRDITAATLTAPGDPRRRQ